MRRDDPPRKGEMTANDIPIFPRPGAPSASRAIGAILVDAGRLTPESAERILRLHKKQGIRFGDAAVALGLLTPEDIRFALSHQFDYSYLPARDSSLSTELVAAYTPFSKVVEQLRALRSQLMLRWFDAEAQRKALAVVSASSGDGRSFIAANLAVVFSQLGERTLLIDADLRRPRQHSLFKLNNDVGLTSMLAGRAGAEAVVRVPSLLALSVLPSGPMPPNPQELLGRQVFSDTLQSLSAGFDIVIIDTPCGTSYADAQTVAVRAGAALLLARENRSLVPQVTRLTRSLQQSGATLVGSVINDV
jgi:chain length determinant protein tyrosine kinase EpsG